MNSKSNSSKNSEKNNENSNSNSLIKEISKENKKQEKNIKLKNKTIDENKTNNLEESKNSEIIPSSESSQNINNLPISLQKISLKNFIVYCKKHRTPKQFYEHQLFLMHRQEKINKSKKMKQLTKEEENYRDYPEISPVSEQILFEKGDYIPIFKRAIELQNQKKAKMILNERKKNKEIDDMIKKYSNSSFYVDKNEINEFYMTQISWKDRIKEKSKTSYSKNQEEKKKEEKKILSYKFQINKNSRRIIENKLKSFNTINNSSLSNNNKSKKRSSENTFERLFKDGKLHEKRINKLIQSYYYPFFRPNIKKNYSFNKTKIKVIPRSKNNYTNSNKTKRSSFVSFYNNSKKLNNISKNINLFSQKLKNNKSYTIFFEDINIQNKNNKNSRNSKEMNNNVKTTKSTKGSYSNKNVNSTGMNTLSTKMNRSQTKDLNPIPIKLGEIKEIDSIIGSSTGRNKNSTGRNKNQKNKNNNLIKKEEGNNFFTKENNSSNDNTFMKRKRSTIKKSINENNEIKEDEKESGNNETEQLNISNSNKVKNSKNNYSKKESKSIMNESNTPKLPVKNPKDNNNSKDIKIQNISKKGNRIINQVLTNNSQTFNDNKNRENYKENDEKGINFLISKENSDILLNGNKDNDNLLLENSLLKLNGSNSFGNLQNSNILENLSNPQLNEKDYLINSKKKNADKENVKNNEDSLLSSTRRKKKELIKSKYKFDAYNNEDSDSENKESLSFDEISALNNGNNDLISKFKIIEEKENKINSKSKINSININNRKEKENKNINLYMLNFRETTSNCIKEPFTITDTKGTFFEFFKKK